MLEHALAEVRAIERELDAAAAALADAADEVVSRRVASRRSSTTGAFGGAPRPTVVDPAERYAAALEATERADVWSAESRRDELLEGLGLAGIGHDRRLAKSCR